MVKGTIDNVYVTYYCKELKPFPVIMQFYYPGFIVSRFIYSAVLAFLYEYPYAQCIIMLVVEGIICKFYLVTYLLLTLPFLQLRNSIFTIFYHLFEISALVMPILYDKGFWDHNGLNNVSAWLCWSCIFILIFRFTSDYMWPPQDSIPNILEPKIYDENRQVTKVESSFNVNNDLNQKNQEAEMKENEDLLFKKRIRPDKESIDAFILPVTGTSANPSIQPHIEPPAIIPISKSFKESRPVTELEFEKIESVRPMKNAMVSPIYSERTDNLRLKSSNQTYSRQEPIRKTLQNLNTLTVRR